MSKAPIILIAEDDKFLIKVYQTKLTKEGFQVEIATNGEEALKLAREKNPDLIFCDLMMPIKDGFETLKELKADPKLKKIKVIILSNLSQEEDKKRVLDLGAEEYIVKADVPFSEVIALAKKYLS
ncbi:MAG: Two component transcriptional regulator, winged helix family [Candidatus Moranbacteria bacterium GW2011_GWA2_39_41]|nr:MAG: Two component transcriptional regulator, winged helix family [Candidatus Moranbacteria bacterium GW2011_GWA2_39_41]